MSGAGRGAAGRAAGPGAPGRCDGERGVGGRPGLGRGREASGRGAGAAGHGGRRARCASALRDPFGIPWAPRPPAPALARRGQGAALPLARVAASWPFSRFRTGT